MLKKSKIYLLSNSSGLGHKVCQTIRWILFQHQWKFFITISYSLGPNWNIVISPEFIELNKGNMTIYISWMDQLNNFWTPQLSMVPYFSLKNWIKVTHSIKKQVRIIVWNTIISCSIQLAFMFILIKTSKAPSWCRVDTCIEIQ